MNLVCPICASSHLEVAEHVILGAGDTHKPAKCLMCGWEGKDSQLLSIPDAVVSKHIDDGLAPDRATAIAKSMTEHLLTLIAKNSGREIGLCLIEAGFVGMKDAQRLGRLIRAACLGAVAKVLDEVELLQKEARDGQPSDPA